MDIQTRKIEFIQAFLKLQSEQTISRLEELLKSESKDFEPMSVDEFNERIDRSEKDFKDGNYKTHDEVFSKYD